MLIVDWCDWLQIKLTCVETQTKVKSEWVRVYPVWLWPLWCSGCGWIDYICQTWVCILFVTTSQEWIAFKLHYLRSVRKWNNFYFMWGIYSSHFRFNSWNHLQTRTQVCSAVLWNHEDSLSHPPLITYRCCNRWQAVIVCDWTCSLSCLCAESQQESQTAYTLNLTWWPFWQVPDKVWPGRSSILFFFHSTDIALGSFLFIPCVKSS